GTTVGDGRGQTGAGAGPASRVAGADPSRDGASTPSTRCRSNSFGSRNTASGSCRRFPQARKPPISCLDNTQGLLTYSSSSVQHGPGEPARGPVARYGSRVPPDAAATFPLPFPLDLELTLGGLQRGPRDPTIRFDGHAVWRASRTRPGPALLRLCLDGPRLRAEAWGAGASWMVDHAPQLVGFDDQPEAFRPTNRLVMELHRHRAPALRGDPDRCRARRPAGDHSQPGTGGCPPPADQPAGDRALVSRRSLRRGLRRRRRGLAGRLPLAPPGRLGPRR